ncbi:MAG: secondary thiamine-phosphate synthase enzyme [Thermoplasmatales archaeon SG8-52-3]|nr:MAG: secondary thiamine-phosphate synthase enzyme [Thermoplasmatales archaeon SG8-52-3]
MSSYNEEINIKTKGEVDIIDITNQVQSIVNKSKINTGIACIFVPGSTGAITTIEYEPGLKKDLPRALQKIAPKGEHYNHHETWHDDNGHSHVRASLMGPSLTIPLINGRVIHGTWQQIVFIELDTSPRNRNLIVQIVGE